MAKGKQEVAPIDIFIEEVLSEDKKTAIKNVLKIPYTANKTNKAIRVYSRDDQQKYYASVRNGSLQQTTEGYECNVTGIEANLLGNRFELTEVATKEIVLRGKILNKKAEATSAALSAGTVVDFQKTGTGK